MKIVIAGAGEVGFHIAKQLSEEKKYVVLIEKNEERAKFASEHLDCMVINGESTSVDILEKAECGNADMFLAVTDSDEINLLSCFFASAKFNISKKAARVRNPEYSTRTSKSLEKFGVDLIINPEMEAAKSIINAVNFGASSDIIIFEDIDIQMRGVYIDQHSILKDRTIIDIKKEIQSDFIVSGIKTAEGNLIIPSGYTQVKEGDYIYIVSKKNNVEDILKQIGKTKIKIRNIAIFGGSKIGVMTAKGLCGKKRNIKIIEKDYEKCKLISQQCKNATIINDDASNADVFEEESIDEFDVAIAATGNEEINLISSLYAKSIGVKRTIAVMDKTNYITMATRLNIDAVVSPKLSSVSSILKFVRKGNIIGVYSIFGGEAEALEFDISQKSKLKNKQIKDANIPKNSLIIALIRDNQSIIPNGELTIRENDRVILFAKKEDITKIENII